MNPSGVPPNGSSREEETLIRNLTPQIPRPSGHAVVAETTRRRGQQREHVTRGVQEEEGSRATGGRQHELLRFTDARLVFTARGEISRRGVKNNRTNPITATTPSNLSESTCVRGARQHPAHRIALRLSRAEDIIAEGSPDTLIRAGRPSCTILSFLNFWTEKISRRLF